MEPEPYGIVYLLIDCTCDKGYVGQTTRSFEERFYEHKRGDQYIDHVIQKHGEDLIETAILKVCYSKEELDYWEKHLIKSFDTMFPNGYNLTEGGEGISGWTQTAEIRAKISASSKGVPKSPEHCAKISLAKRGKNHPFFGKHLPMKTRIKQSLAHKGKKFSKEHCLKLALGRKGKRHFVESLVKMSKVHRGVTPYKNLIAEMDAHNLSYAAIAKLLNLGSGTVSDKMRGKQNFTAEQIAKLVEFFGKPAEYLMARAAD